jgi:hypothetical protein
MEKHPDTGIISCPLYFPDGKLQGTRRKLKTFLLFWQSLLLSYIFEIKFLRNYLKISIMKATTVYPSSLWKHRSFRGFNVI